jgi:hypothetical protein
VLVDPVEQTCADHPGQRPLRIVEGVGVADAAGGGQRVQQPALPVGERGEDAREVGGRDRAPVAVDEEPRQIGGGGEQSAEMCGDPQRRGRVVGCRIRPAVEGEIGAEHETPVGQVADRGLLLCGAGTVVVTGTGGGEQPGQGGVQIGGDDRGGDRTCGDESVEDGELGGGEFAQGGGVTAGAGDHRGPSGSGDGPGVERPQSPEQVDKVRVGVAGQPVGVSGGVFGGQVRHRLSDVTRVAGSRWRPGGGGTAAVRRQYGGATAENRGWGASPSPAVGVVHRTGVE